MPKYCIACRAVNPEELVEENKVYYQCPKCGNRSGRAVIVDNKIKIINTSRGIKHISVAAIIIHDNKILLADRRTYPFGFEIPVGHLEYDETLEDALRREVYEEVGLKISGETLITQIEQPVSYCRYGSDVEEWAVFFAECKGHEFVNNSEFESIQWFPLDAIPVERLTPQTRFILNKLEYIDHKQSGKHKKVRVP